MKFLLENGADITNDRPAYSYENDSCDNHPCLNAYHFCLEGYNKKSHRFMKFLLEQGLDIMNAYNCFNNSVHEIAMEHPKLLDELIKICPDPRALRDVLMGAIEKQNKRVFQKVLKIIPVEALNRASRRGTPLTVAVKSPGRSSYWTWKLLKRGADPNAHFSFTPLQCANESRRYDLVELLISHGADFNINGCMHEVLFVDAYKRPKLLEILVAKGADFDVSDKSGWTALKKSLRDGIFKSFSYLIENGASLKGCARQCSTEESKDYLAKFDL